MREPEGIETPPPGESSERPWSKHREPDIRNVEAEGSSPFTSTKGPVQKAKVESPKVTSFVDVSLRDFIGHIRVTSRPEMRSSVRRSGTGVSCGVGTATPSKES